MQNKFILFILILVLVQAQHFAQQIGNTEQVDTIPRYTYSTLQEFSEQMDDIFNDPNFSNANWGVVIQSLETGEYFYKRNEDKLFVPASNMKLFTSAAGLLLLGEDYKFSTNILYEGKIDGSILEGNLVVQGRGDPTISGRFYNDNITQVFSDWADSLLALGIDEISGDIIGDDNLFDDLGLGQGWSWDYESYWYAAQSGAISLNDNCIDVIIKHNKKNDSLEVSFYPESKYAAIKNNLRLVPADSNSSVNFYRERNTNLITLYGTFSRATDSLKVYVTVNNPTQYAMVVLKKILMGKGIYVHGLGTDIDEYSKTIEIENLESLFTHYSKPMTDIVRVINKGSHNFYAEQLLKTIGLEIEGLGTVENGVTAAKNIFKEIGLNPDNIVMADGSGLSHHNLVSPRQIISLLRYMYNSKSFIPFYNSLPISGVDGTLGNRMKNTRAQNNVRAKTGYIRSARSLSGYTKTGDNEVIAFSMIANNFNVPVKLAENIQDLVCLRLANFRRK